VTHLRKMMLEELQRRNYAETTIRSYIRIVKDFSRRFQRPPDRLGPEHIREYQSELFTKRKFAASTVTVYLAALRFFYTKTLKRVWSTTETPYPKRVSALPAVLSQEEVAQLIDAALTPFHRTLLMTLYATGVRCRVNAPESYGHRQPAHGHSRPGRQGSQRSRCHAEPETARRVPQALAPVRAKAKRVAVSRQPAP
jgi:integrase